MRRLSVEQLIAEDAALDKSCTDALSFVRTCEQLRGYNKQVQPNTVSTTTPCTLRDGVIAVAFPAWGVLTLSWDTPLMYKST